MAQKVLTLPEKPNTPSNELTDYLIMLYGSKGVGKSSLAAEFPKAITFMFERGRKSLPILQVPQAGEPALDWPQTLSYLMLVCKNREKFKTVVIDTLDKMTVTAEKNVCQAKGIVSAAAACDYGATWIEIREAIEKALFGVINCGVMPLLISHAQLKDVQTKSGATFQQVVPTTPQTILNNFVRPCCDIVLCYDYIDGRRAIIVRGGDFIFTSGGVPGHWFTKSGRPIRAFFVGEDGPEEAYHRLMLAWNCQLPDEFLVPDNWLTVIRREGD